MRILCEETTKNVFSESQAANTPKHIDAYLRNSNTSDDTNLRKAILIGAESWLT